MLRPVDERQKSIGINKSYCHAMGILITANHIEMVLVNLGDEIIKKIASA